MNPKHEQQKTQHSLVVWSQKVPNPTEFWRLPRRTRNPKITAQEGVREEKSSKESSLKFCVPFSKFFTGMVIKRVSKRLSCLARNLSELSFLFAFSSALSF